MMIGFAIVGDLILTSCGSGLLIAKRLRDIAWAYCPEVQAAVESGCAYLTEDGSRYVGLVIYSYSVAAKTYYGSCRRSFTTPRAALHFIEHSSTSRLTARYKPENPEESRLFTELDEEDWERRLIGKLDSHDRLFDLRRARTDA